jgi:hypothetical protein
MRSGRLQQNLYRRHYHVPQHSFRLLGSLEKLHVARDQAGIGGAMALKIIERVQADGCYLR